MRLREDELERADGFPGLYGDGQKSPAALIVPVEDAGVWLVEQYRNTLRRRAWEVPQAAWEHAPGASEEALARGDLAEETGLRAAPLERLGQLSFCYGISDQPVV